MDTELLPALVGMSPLCFYFHDWYEPKIPGISGYRFNGNSFALLRIVPIDHAS
jgi:hypothetical protein